MQNDTGLADEKKKTRPYNRMSALQLALSSGEKYATIGKAITKDNSNSIISYGKFGSSQAKLHRVKAV